jgi:hypothetical protein
VASFVVVLCGYDVFYFCCCCCCCFLSSVLLADFCLFLGFLKPEQMAIPIEIVRGIAKVETARQANTTVSAT